MIVDHEHDLDPDYFTEVVLPSDPSEAIRLVEVIVPLLEAHHREKPAVLHVRLALEEALINAVKHGNQLDPNKKVRVIYRVLRERFDIVITDEGPGFDPKDVPDPTAMENLERPCGRGLLLMRHYMTEVVYNTRGNSVRMSKLFSNNPTS
jgi:serine/threonine-protein kinase RsbW